MTQPQTRSGLFLVNLRQHEQKTPGAIIATPPVSNGAMASGGSLVSALFVVLTFA